jgi:hypothetical protein
MVKVGAAKEADVVHKASVTKRRLGQEEDSVKKKTTVGG